MRIVKRLFAAMLSTALVFTNTVSSFADEAEAPLPDETVQVEETVVEQAPEEQDPVVSDVEISQEDTETVTVQESEQTENNNQFNQVPITGTNSQNGVTVNVSAPVNSFPEGTNVVIVPVDSQQSGLYVQDVAPYGSAIGFDISFVNGSAQVQPANGQAVSLEFVIESDSAFTKYPSSTIDLYHIYNGAVELLSAMNSYTEGSTTIIRVSAVSFSPFILVENGEITVEESDEQEASKAVQNNVITGFDLYTQNGSTPIGTTTIAQWQIMRLTAQFALPNGEVHAGDTTTLTLPNELRFSQVANFNITDSEGNVVAHAVIDGNNKTITLTYTEYPETHSDVTGSFFFYVQMDRTVVLQPTTVVLEMDVNGNVVPSGPYTFEGVPDPTPFAGDKSGWQKASDDQRRLVWRIRLNTNGEGFSGLTISDELNADQISYDRSTFTITKGTWENRSGDWYLAGATDVTSQYTVNWGADGKSYSVVLGDVGENEGYVIRYETVSDYDLQDSELITNSATLTSSSGSTRVLRGAVRFALAGGSAEGYVFGIDITKVDANTGANLAGATFNVIRAINGSVVGTITTDASGQGSIRNLLKETYYLQEVTPPAGYTLSDTQYTVTPDMFGSNKIAVLQIENTINNVSVDVEKNWIGPPVGSVKVFLLGNGQVVDEVVLSNDNQWKHTFEDLPKYDGTEEIVYQVEEELDSSYSLVSITQQENHFYITNKNEGKINIPVRKFWVGPEVESVVVHLKKGDEIIDEIQLSAANSWAGSFDNLPLYDSQGNVIIYTVDEVDIPGYQSEITGIQSEGFSITNTNYETTYVSVKKQWAGTPAENVTVYLLADDVEMQSAVLDAGNNWSFVFENLEKYDKNDGHEIKYTVREVEIEGYNSVITGSVESGFIITNTITGKTSIGVTKTWIGPKGESVTVNLLANGAQKDSIVLSEDNDWQYTFTNLDKYDENGVEILYTIDEVNVPNYSTDIVEGEQSFTIINTNEEKVSIPVSKNWVGTPAESVTVRLLADGSEIAQISLDSTSSWSGEFSGLPKYDAADGHEIVYSVTEDPIENYATIITGDVSTGFTITNTITGKTSIGVTKVWVGPAAERVTVNLLANGVQKDSIVLSEDNNWQHSFTDLDQYDQNGVEIEYTVDEVNVPNYSTTVVEKNGTFVIINTNNETVTIPVQKNWSGESIESVTVRLLADGTEIQSYELSAADSWYYEFTHLAKYDQQDGHEIVYTVTEDAVENYTTVITGDANTGFTITNTITGKTSIGITKKWEGPAAESVTVNLLANGTQKDSVVLSEANQWQYTFVDLDQYDENGKVIVYTIDEVSLPDYITTITEDTGGFLIRNTNTETVEVPVKKVWVGAPLESIQVTLIVDGVETEPVVIDEQAGWEHTFTDLPKYAADGHVIEYAVREIPNLGYNTTVTGDSASGFIITNTITGKTSVDVTKVWVGPAADSVTVTLFANGSKKDEAVLTAANSWKHTFSDLDKYDEQGNEIVYTVSEQLEGYVSVVDGDAQNGFVILNTNVEEISIPVKKQWAGAPLESVTVYLVRDGEVLSTRILNDANNWSDVFENLAKYDSADGHEFVYDVIEETYENYTSTITGDVTTGFTITNTITGKTSVGVTKKWIGPAADNITVNLMANGVLHDSVELSSANDWQHTFIDLELYDENGVEISYTIDEVSIENYQSEIVQEGNSYVITNKNTETIEIPVKKTWIGKPGEQIELILERDGEEAQPVIVTADDNWEYTFKDLIKYDPVDGHEYQYTVREWPIEGYNTVVTGDTQNGFHITNTITGKVSVGVTKKWIGPEQDEITVNLLQDGNKIDSAVLNADNNWQFTFTELEQYDDKDGHEFTYTIEELEITNYSVEITEEDTNTFVITNTNEETLDIPVKKNWVGKPTDQIVVVLLADTAEEQTVLIGAEENWEYTFKDLPKYDKNDGHEILYEIKEIALENYNSVITGDVENGFTITNTITGKVSVGVTKKWVGKKQNSVTVRLLADGDVIDTATLNDGNGWQFTFEGLEQYKEGKEIEYTVEEVEIKGYSVTISGSVEDGFVITNTENEKPTPKTGVNLNTAFWVSCLALACAGAYIAYKKTKKK